ncbi:hypothetical protein, partial [Lactobacillus crispatus]
MGEIIEFIVVLFIFCFLLMLIWALIKWLFTTITGWLVISLITGIILTIVGINKEIKKCKAKKVKKDLEQEYA